MQWTDSANGGFCLPDVKPWMRVNDDYVTINAAVQTSPSESKLSVYQFWQKCLALRKERSDVITYGDFELADADHPSIFAFKRTGKSRGLLTVLNFTPDVVSWEVPADIKVREWLVGNYFVGTPENYGSGSMELRPWEGLVAILD